MCFICQKFPKTPAKIQGQILERLVKLFDKIKVSDARFPAVVCGTCRVTLVKSDKNLQKRFSNLPDYSSFRSLKSLYKRLNPNGTCNCKLCVNVRLRGNISKSRVPEKTCTRKIIPNKDHEKRCSECLQLISRGVNHTCSSAIETVVDIIQTKFIPKKQEQVLSSLLKLKVKNVKDIKEGQQPIQLSQVRGKALPVIVKPAQKKKVSPMPAEKMSELQRNFNLTNRQTIGIAKAFRQGVQSRKAVESNFEQKLNISSHILDVYFETQKLDFLKKTKKEEVMSVEDLVFCNDLKGLIQHIVTARNLYEYHLKFGIDGGGGFLKICMSVQSTNAETLNVSYKTSKNLKNFKDSGVKGVFLIALVTVQENYFNVSKIWEILGINSFLDTIATDLKLGNIMTGLMSHSSTYPCTWCDAPSKNLNNCGTYRTIVDCIGNYEEWVKNGSDEKKAKLFKNCIHPPIYASENSQEILDIFPPPELHLLIGGVNKLFDHMRGEFKCISEDWETQCHVKRKNAHGGNLSFAGNACKLLLNNVDKLRMLCNRSLGCLKYVDCFQKLKMVVDSCFSMTLQADYVKHINLFKESYEALGISVTPKIHAIFFHVTEFCSKTGKGLGFYSEQVIESLHHDFSDTWKNFKVLKEHPQYKDRLLRAVCQYNSKHL